MDMDLETKLERLKNYCTQSSGDSSDEFCVEIEKNGFKAYVVGTVYYHYYKCSASYYEPAEDDRTIQCISWDVDSFDEDLAPTEDGYSKEDIEDMTSQIEEKEVIDAICKEYGYEY